MSLPLPLPITSLSVRTAWPSQVCASWSSPCELRPASSAYDISCASSWLRSTMPCCANITALNLMLKPILRILADSNSGRSASSASSVLIWSGAIARLFVAERDIAGVVGRERERNAADLGPHRIDRIGLGLDREMTGLARACDAGRELFEIADGVILAAIDRRFTRSFRAGGGERNGCALEACGFVFLSPSRFAGWAPSPACGGGWSGGVSPGEQIATRPARGGVAGFVDLLRKRQRRKNAGATFHPRIGFYIRWINLRIFGDPSRQRGKLHRLQERDQLPRIRLVYRQLIERHLELHLVVEQHQLPRDPRLLGILDQRLAPLRLLYLARAKQQRFEITIFDDQLRRGLDADAGHAGHVVGGIPR